MQIIVAKSAEEMAKLVAASELPQDIKDAVAEITGVFKPKEASSPACNGMTEEPKAATRFSKKQLEVLRRCVGQVYQTNLDNLDKTISITCNEEDLMRQVNHRLGQNADCRQTLLELDDVMKVLDQLSA